MTALLVCVCSIRTFIRPGVSVSAVRCHGLAKEIAKQLACLMLVSQQVRGGVMLVIGRSDER